MTDEGTLQALQASSADRQTLLGWTGVLLPPTVFLTHLTCSYALSYWSCLTGRSWALQLTTPVALALVALSALAARGSAPVPSDADAGHRVAGAFLSQLGLWSSGLFALATLAGALPRLLLHPCAQY
jgi:hypothetical protein